MKEESPLEIEVLAHRYLYYVLGQPIISDYDYDQLEQRALPQVSPDSPLHQPGSDLSSSYSQRVKARAEEMRNKPGQKAKK